MDTDTRRAVTEDFQELIDTLTQDCRSEATSGRRSEAMLMLASMVGAMTVAQMVDDIGLSRQILDVARSRLLGWLGEASLPNDSNGERTIN